MVSAHTKDRVRSVPCDHNPEEEQRVKRRVRRDVEPPEVRRFLRQELLIKVGHSWWNRPRVYRYDKDDEREPTQSRNRSGHLPRHRPLKEPSRGKWWPRPATPSSRRGTQPPLPRVAREQGDSNREPASKDGRDRSPGRTSSPAAEVGVDAQTPEGRIPERNRAEAGVSPVQP